MNKKSLTGALAAAATVAALSLSGCADTEVLNAGGDTSCKDYLEQDSDQQRNTVTKFLQEDSDSDTEPAGTVVDATMLAVGVLCDMPENADKEIRDADLAGVKIPTG